jgi:hypothetical protein
MARVVAFMVGPLLSLVAFLVDFFFSSSCIPEKMMWKSFWVRFDVRKVAKSQKHAKQGNLLHSVKPNERVLFRKPPESMANKSKSS